MEISKLLNPISPPLRADPKSVESSAPPISSIENKTETPTTAPLDADQPQSVLEILRFFQNGVRNNEVHGQKFHLHATVLKSFNRAAGPHVIKGLKVDKNKAWTYLVEDERGERKWMVERYLEAA